MEKCDLESFLTFRTVDTQKLECSNNHIICKNQKHDLIFKLIIIQVFNISYFDICNRS